MMIHTSVVYKFFMHIRSLLCLYICMYVCVIPNTESDQTADLIILCSSSIYLFHVETMLLLMDRHGRMCIVHIQYTELEIAVGHFLTNFPHLAEQMQFARPYLLYISYGKLLLVYSNIVSASEEWPTNFKLFQALNIQ